MGRTCARRRSTRGGSSPRRDGRRPPPAGDPTRQGASEGNTSQGRAFEEASRASHVAECKKEVREGRSRDELWVTLMEIRTGRSSTVVSLRAPTRRRVLSTRSRSSTASRVLRFAKTSAYSRRANTLPRVRESRLSFSFAPSVPFPNSDPAPRAVPSRAQTRVSRPRPKPHIPLVMTPTVPIAPSTPRRSARPRDPTRETRKSHRFSDRSDSSFPEAEKTRRLARGLVTRHPRNGGLNAEVVRS